MKQTDFTATFLTKERPDLVFDKIKNVRSWWSGVFGEEIEGKTDKLDDEFAFRAGGGAHYSKQKLVELVPQHKIVWLVSDSKLEFLKNKTEWTGTQLVFDFAEQDGQTKIVFTHRGLKPGVECFEACSDGWNQYFEKKLRPMLSE